MAFETGSPLVECVNLALEEMKADGTLDAIHQKWLVGEDQRRRSGLHG